MKKKTPKRTAQRSLVPKPKKSYLAETPYPADTMQTINEKKEAHIPYPIERPILASTVASRLVQEAFAKVKHALPFVL